MVFFEWSLKLQNFLKELTKVRSVKITFTKKYFHQQSALCSIILANYLGIIKKFARKQFSCYLCLLYFSNKLITFFESTINFILNILLPLSTIKGWKVSWIKVWTFSEKVKNQFSQSFLPLLCDRHWIENCIENHQIE